METFMIRPLRFGLHEFCIEGETEEPKAFGNPNPDEQPVKDRVKETLNKATLCLRTFKEGHVGYDYVHFFPVTFCPLPMPSYGYGDLYVPFGNYTLMAEEIGCDSGSFVFLPLTTNVPPAVEGKVKEVLGEKNAVALRLPAGRWTAYYEQFDAPQANMVGHRVEARGD